ncbi:hypothetical protein TNCV_3163571 [Trichonephila clavipes]|nr:hypothetical protein TNCV_3163571 [Trichonephila clavipes]
MPLISTVPHSRNFQEFKPSGIEDRSRTCKIYGYSGHGYLSLLFVWLYLNGLYAKVARACVLNPFNPQDRQHVNLNVYDWGHVMLPDEFRFVLQPNDKGVRAWRKQSTHNWPENIIGHYAFPVEDSWPGEGSYWDISLACTSISAIL